MDVALTLREFSRSAPCPALRDCICFAWVRLFIAEIFYLRLQNIHYKMTNLERRLAERWLRPQTVVYAAGLSAADV
jgi:hypothetical protein